MSLLILLKKEPGEEQTKFYISLCSYCGKPYFRTHNRNTLCSYECRVKSKQDSDALYSRKRRKAINEGKLVVRDKQLGTSTVLLSKKPKEDFYQEHLAIMREKRRVGIISQ